MDLPADPLESFHPLVREWFRDSHRSPTPVQAAAWPRIAAGEHLLALAPTGSGKTLTAFLGAISRIASGEFTADRCSVLYVSPLKALGEDIRRNLEDPLDGIATLFRARGAALPDIRVATRTGDTSQADRRRMLSKPPSILVTTPESLCLMLDAVRSREILRDVRLLILDEVHAVAGSKRGSLLACAVGRLVLLAGEFQRIALSATVSSPELVAAFVGGRRLEPGRETRFVPRRVAVVSPTASKRIELSVEWPEAVDPAPGAPGRKSSQGENEANATRYSAIVPAIAERMAATRSLIVFTDSRRRAERMAFLINEAAGEGSAWAHHGSLAKEARRVVEERLKAGELACVVATASLELGIDIGSVDEVLLAGSPNAVSSALQRIGRSGHAVGETSRGRLYPFHGMDLVLAAAVAQGVEERAVEEIVPVSSPLDILAQVLLELAAEEPRHVDALYDIVRSFPPFAELARALFDSTVEMLAGRFAETRLRELEARIWFDRESGIVQAKDGARALLYSSGGSIPDRGLYSLRLQGSRVKIGELDEEFVWERSPGDAFSFGTQSWRIVSIGAEAVEVVPLGRDADFMPFWKGDSRFRSREITTRALGLLDRLDALDPEEGSSFLEKERGFSQAAARACSRFVGAQKAAGLGSPSLPGSRRIVLEANADPARRGDSHRLILHTLRGLAINEPLSEALAAAWEESGGVGVQTLADDDSILLVVPQGGNGETPGEDPAGETARMLRGLAEPGRIEALVRKRFEGSGLFGAEFRANAGRALLLPRGLPGKRIPLWITRLRAKKLFEAVRGYPDFPVIVETWRSCLADLLDLGGARSLVEDLASGRVELSAFSSRSPSPFAREAIWKETGEFLYRGDAIETRATSSVSDRVVAEALRSSSLRPLLDRGLVDDFVRRLKRLVPGWAPEDARSLAEWAKERVLIPADELPEIVATAGAGLAEALAADPSCGGRLRRITLPGAEAEVLVHSEREKELRADPAALLPEWLRREGPVLPSRVSRLFGLPEPDVDLLLGDLAADGVVVVDAFVRGSEEIAAIDAQNLEILLRRSRAAARPRVEARPGEDYLRFVAAVQELAAPIARNAPSNGDRRPGRERLSRRLEALSGFPAPVALWETEILPARFPFLSAADLDSLAAEGEWQWFGAGKGIVCLSRVQDLELFLSFAGAAKGAAASSRLIPPGSKPMDFWAVRELSGGSVRDCALALWAEAWKGLVASSSFIPLREGLANDFGKALAAAAPSPAGTSPFGARRRVPLALKERWRAGAPVSGSWYRLEFEEGEDPDALDEEALNAARVRILVRRYGLVCRAILERELPSLSWSSLFPALRRLELAGELVAGRFFEGLDGPQFLGSERIGLLTELDARSPAGPIWLAALDPVAAAAYALAERPDALPPRLASNRICFSGGRAVGFSTRGYRDLSLSLPPGHPDLPVVLGIFRAARERAARPESRVVIETIDGVPASRSIHANALREGGFEADRGRLVLW